MNPLLKPQQLIEILLVDDTVSDIELMREAFADARVTNRVHAVYDGEEALEFLYRRGKHVYAVRPDLILIDLSMPRKTGKEVLAVVKEDDGLKNIPVIVLTGSQLPEDIQDSYRLHANAYIVKPSDLNELMRVVEAVENFWLRLAKLPLRMTDKGDEACAS